MPLVDKIAELKMIRSLQMRINHRTQRYGEMLKADQAETPDLLKSSRTWPTGSNVSTGQLQICSKTPSISTAIDV